MIMDGSAVTCWYGVFLDAYKYSSSYLLFTLSVILTSIITLWIYERPQIYKLIYKRSKLSESLTPQQSAEIYEENCIQNLMEDGNDTFVEKKLRELPKDDTEQIDKDLLRKYHT